MTTPLVPEVPELPGPPRAPRNAAGTLEGIATGALLGILVPAIVLASTVPAVPTAPLVAVTALLLVAVLVPAAAASRRDPARAAVRPCGLEDVSDTLRCELPAGHTGLHLDVRTVRAFDETLDVHIGDAGAYYRDGQGRPVPVDDVF